MAQAQEGSTGVNKLTGPPRKAPSGDMILEWLCAAPKSRQDLSQVYIGALDHVSVLAHPSRLQTRPF